MRLVPSTREQLPFAHPKAGDFMNSKMDVKLLDSAFLFLCNFSCIPGIELVDNNRKSNDWFQYILEKLRMRKIIIVIPDTGRDKY